EGAIARMTVINADGSRPEMCGNGLRCVAGWLVDRGRAPEGAWVVAATDAGPRPFRADRTEDGFDVAIRMGAATFGGELVVDVDGGPVAFERVGMGNPHAVRFGAFDDADLARLGPTVATAPRGGTNVELV